MDIALPQAVRFLLDTLHRNNHKAYIIGGCVRDAVLGMPIHDYDITTSAHPALVQELFQKEGIAVIPTGLKHGTITLRIDHENYEVTTFRTEKDYRDHRTPNEVAFADTLPEDVKRRDFTINTLAYNEEAGLLDLVGGLEDLNKRIIRCVGNPDERFEEDALRILRALRFTMSLRFTIEPVTWSALQRHASLLTNISAERIRDEWNRMLMSEYDHTLDLLYDSGVMDIVFPELSKLHHRKQHSLWHPYDMFEHTQLALQHTSDYTLAEKLAVVFHDIGKPDTMYLDEHHHGHFPHHAKVSTELTMQIMKRLKYDHATIQTVCRLIACHDSYLQPNERFMRRFLGKLEGDYSLCHSIIKVQLADDHAKDAKRAKEKIDILIHCQRIVDELERQHPALTLSNLAVNGNDLKAMGLTGAQIGKGLKRILQEVIEGTLHNTKEDCLAYIKKHVLNGTL